MDPQIITSLVKTIELKDHSTAAHTWRVVLYTRALAEEFGIDHDTIARLTTAAALHDIGKIDLPDAILQKPGPLTPAEYEIIKTHADLGHARLLRMEESDSIILDLVRHHHERLDGLGYPDALAGDQIAQAARFFSVIDTFDALTSHRPYRHQVGEAAADRAISELEASRGTRYWPDAVNAFARLYRTGNLNWILHHFNDANATPQFHPEKARTIRPQS